MKPTITIILFILLNGCKQENEGKIFNKVFIVHDTLYMPIDTIKYFTRPFGSGFAVDRGTLYLEVMRDAKKDNLTIKGDTEEVINWLMDMIQSRDSVANRKSELIEYLLRKNYDYAQ